MTWHWKIMVQHQSNGAMATDEGSPCTRGPNKMSSIHKIVTNDHNPEKEGGH